MLCTKHQGCFCFRLSSRKLVAFCRDHRARTAWQNGQVEGPAAEPLIVNTSTLKALADYGTLGHGGSNICGIAEVCAIPDNARDLFRNREQAAVFE